MTESNEKTITGSTDSPQNEKPVIDGSTDSPQSEVPKRRRRLSVSHVPDAPVMDQMPPTMEEVRGFVTSNTLDVKGPRKETDETKPATSKSRTRRLSVSGRVNYLEQQEYALKEQAVKSSSGQFNPKDLLTMGISYGCHKGLKPESPNQDDFFLIRIDDWGLYGVFDGHGPVGHTIANFVQREFPKTLYSPEFLNGDYNTVSRILKDGFDQVERKLEELKLDITLSGSTGSVVYHRMKFKKLICAHVGDSRVVLGRLDTNNNIVAEDLTDDHKPQDPVEKKRIEENGGVVRQIQGDVPHRVFHRGLNYPGLAMSRAFGDVSGRQCGVISIPDISEHSIDTSDLFIILASDGIWEFIESQEAVEIVHALGRSKVDEACEKLCQEAWARWIENEEGQVVDDITAEIIYLQEE